MTDIAEELAGIPLPEDEGGGVDGAPVAEGEAAPSPFIGREEFWGLFQAAHQIPGHMAGLQTLITAPDRPAAKPASDAIYDICVDTPSMHWLLAPGGVWVPRILAIAAYGVPLMADLRRERRERRESKAAPLTAHDDPVQGAAVFVEPPGD